MDEILRQGRADLQQLRADPASSAALTADTARRAQVLWALQYDRRPADLPLLRAVVDDRLRELITSNGEPIATDQEVSEWLQGRRAWFPDDARNETTQTSPLRRGCSGT